MQASTHCNRIAATSAELDLWAQVEKLSPAIERYNSRVITSLTGNFNGNEKFDIGDLTVIQYYYGEKVTDESIEILRKADIDDNGEIGLEDLMFVAQKVLQ